MRILTIDQYELTKKWAERFTADIELAENAEPAEDMHPEIRLAGIRAMQSMRADLLVEMAEWESKKHVEKT